MRIVALVLLAAAAAPGHADIGEGRWEMKITTELPGLPVGIGPVEQTQCLTAAEARDPARLFGGSGAGCAFTNRRDDGATYRFELSCASGMAQVSGSGEIRYTSDTLQGELLMRLGAEGQALEMRSHIQARRLGPCR